MRGSLSRIGNGFLAIFAGIASFVLTLLGFLLLSRIDQQIVGSLFIGLFALLVVRIATERPNTRHAKAVAALIDRLLAVGRGDLTSPAPYILRTEMPALAGAVDGLFEQVRTSLDNFQTMAMYDPVTSLPNRLHFRKEAERMLGARRPDQLAALLFIDLDGFKEVNDRLGHAQGDQVLTMVANRLRDVVTSETISGSLVPPLLARLAGDEFTLLLPDVPSREEALRIAERGLLALCEPFRCGGQISQMGASIGIALCPDDLPDLPGLMKAADRAMYHAKASGRSRVCFNDADLAKAARERDRVEEALMHAIGRRELELVFRPELCLRTGAVLAGEALVQWRGAGRAPILVQELSGLAVDPMLAAAIGDWTLETAAMTSARWRAAGLGQRLSIALPGSLAEGDDLAERLEGAFALAGPEPWLVELELPHDQLARCSANMRAQFERLRRSGISIALYGLGSGETNLAALGSFPTERVKLDASLVADIDLCDRARTILAALVHLLHALGCVVVAAPVARQEQLEVLRAVGCDAVQGFFGAEPMSEQAFIDWIVSQEGARNFAQAADPSAASTMRA